MWEAGASDKGEAGTEERGEGGSFEGLRMGDWGVECSLSRVDVWVVLEVS